MLGQNPDIAGAVAQSLKDIIVAIGRPRAAAFVRRIVPTGKQRVHGGTVSIRLPNRLGAADAVEDGEAEASSIWGKLQMAGAIRGGDELALCRAIVLGEVQIVILGEEQSPLGSPGGVMTDDVTEAAGRPGGERQGKKRGLSGANKPRPQH